MILLKDATLLKQQAFIDNIWIDAETGETIPVDNPSDGKRLGFVPSLGAAEIDRAVDSAHRALKKWQHQTAKERSVLLRRWYRMIMKNQEDLATIMTAEQGKPLAEAMGEVAYAAAFIEWFAEEGKRIYGDTIPTPQSGSRIVVLKEPVGVCAAITPWNFPAAMITRKVGPALAAGCTIVVKPASQTPFTALALAELALRAGLPAGVLNVVTGASAIIGETLLSNMAIRKISFTGSTEVGQKLMRRSADSIKKISLELGGHAPFIVFDDANIDAAVEGAVASKYRNSGQTCVCANRMLVQSGVHDEFAKKLVDKVKALKVADGFEPGSQQGPLIDMSAVEKVEKHIAEAVSSGARLLTGGRRHARGGTYFEPTVLSNVTTNMRIAKEETFGPVAPIIEFEDEVEGLRMANDTIFGLAAYFYSRDIGRIWRVSEGLEYGIVGINTGIISTEVAPFGGMKQSGIGREGSKYGIEEYLEIKYLCMAGVDS
jgi:succinate-semialdehyde dehydrogenase/glutarate-semialdehyde dehydrogenase